MVQIISVVNEDILLESRKLNREHKNDLLKVVAPALGQGLHPRRGPKVPSPQSRRGTFFEVVGEGVNIFQNMGI